MSIDQLLKNQYDLLALTSERIATYVEASHDFFASSDLVVVDYLPGTALIQEERLLLDLKMTLYRGRHTFYYLFYPCLYFNIPILIIGASYHLDEILVAKLMVEIYIAINDCSDQEQIATLQKIMDGYVKK